MDLEVLNLCLSIGASIASIAAAIVAIAPPIRQWLYQKSPKTGKNPIASQDQDDLLPGLPIRNRRRSNLSRQLSQKHCGFAIPAYAALSKKRAIQVSLVRGSLKNFFLHILMCGLSQKPRGLTILVIKALSKSGTAIYRVSAFFKKLDVVKIIHVGSSNQRTGWDLNPQPTG